MLSINPVYDAVGDQLDAKFDLYGSRTVVLVVVDHFKEHSTHNQYRLNHNMNRDIRKYVEYGMDLLRTLIKVIRPNRMLKCYLHKP